MSFTDFDRNIMARALELAEQAQTHGEVPVGAVLVSDGIIIGEGYNQPITKHDATAHAEVMAIRAACKAQNNYRLSNTTLYVTLEPCAMCAGAIVHSRVEHLVFALSDEKTGSCGTVIDLVSANPTGHRVKVSSGLMANESKSLIQGFFKQRRLEKKQEKLSR